MVVGWRPMILRSSSALGIYPLLKVAHQILAVFLQMVLYFLCYFPGKLFDFSVYCGIL